MVRVVFGTGLARAGQSLEVEALTLGALKESLGRSMPGLEHEEVRYFVNGQDAATMQGDATPVDVEDTVLVAPAA